MVVKLFGEVENKSVPIPEFPLHPFQEEHLRVRSRTDNGNISMPLAPTTSYLNYIENNPWLFYDKHFFVLWQICFCILSSVAILQGRAH